MSKNLILFSGGQDSTTCLWKSVKEGNKTSALIIRYGQKHDYEIVAAYEVIERINKKLPRHQKVDVIETGVGASTLISNSPLTTQGEVEQYPDGNLPKKVLNTFVPMRNLLFITVAANRAYVLNYDSIIIGVNNDDYHGYPDCRDAFISSARVTIGLAASREIRLETPLVHKNKNETVQLMIELEGYDLLGYTHTCYDGDYPPVKPNHANVLRAKGFEEAGVPDPLFLRAFDEKRLTDLPESYNYNSYRDLQGTSFDVASIRYGVTPDEKTV